MKSRGFSDQRAIGGVFGLQAMPAGRCLADGPSFLGSSIVRLANARCALYTAVRATAVGRVWLPSFTCPELVQAVTAADAKVSWYQVDRSLAITGVELDQFDHGDALVLNNYFGFPGDRALASSLQNRGVVIIEDAAQSLLSPPVVPEADFRIYSPRKFLGVADGGMLQVNRALTQPIPRLGPPNAEWTELAISAARERAKSDRDGEKRDWYQMFRKAEEGAPVGYFEMSKLSSKLLDCAFDFPAISLRRRQNFAVLLDALHENALFKSLPDDVVPLGFPIMVDRRDELQSFLAEQRIFAPVHWRIDGVIPKRFKASHDLSRRILTLPCDQRYGPSDMNRTLQALFEYGIGQ